MLPTALWWPVDAQIDCGYSAEAARLGYMAIVDESLAARPWVELKSTKLWRKKISAIGSIRSSD